MHKKATKNKTHDDVLKVLNERYRRESGNVNFDYMINTTMMVVGVGAFGQAVEQFARLGIGRFYLFDPDIVELHNLPSQNFTHDDIGFPKTTALKKRLQAVAFEKNNPDIPSLEVREYGDFLAIKDKDIQDIIENERKEKRQVILILATDYHPAQARGSRIALRYKIPVFWVGIYRMGMAGEIIFNFPGVDLPCYRCITESRYQFYDKNRLSNRLKNISNGSGHSTGLPMAAGFIDSILCHLIIGAIHLDIHENQHARVFRKLLRKKRNLIQCQLDSTYKLSDTEDIFDELRGPNIITFNTIFQRENKNTHCIDCQGFEMGRVWSNSDYTEENYRTILERFSFFKSALLRDKEYLHPLLKEYQQLFPEWEKIQNSLSNDEKVQKILIESNGKLIGSISLESLPVKKLITNIIPGHFKLKYNNGQFLWDETINENDLFWNAAFPEQPLEFAAETEKTDFKVSRKITLLNGKVRLRMIPGLESGSIEITIKA